MGSLPWIFRPFGRKHTNGKSTRKNIKRIIEPWVLDVMGFAAPVFSSIFHPNLLKVGSSPLFTLIVLWVRKPWNFLFIRNWWISSLHRYAKLSCKICVFVSSSLCVYLPFPHSRLPWLFYFKQIFHFDYCLAMFTSNFQCNFYMLFFLNFVLFFSGSFFEEKPE